MGKYGLSVEKLSKFSWKEDKEIAIINWGAFYYTFGKSGIKYDKSQDWVLLDEKQKSNLKFLKDKILLLNDLLLLTFVLFSFRQRVIS